MAEWLIPDVESKLREVLTCLRVRKGSGAELAQDEIVDEYRTRYPGDEEYMRRRHEENSGSHSLSGYLGGMLAAYVNKSGDEEPRVERVDKGRYRFAP